MTIVTRAETGLRGPVRVLLVEDNPGDALLVRELLVAAFPAGFELREAATVAQAESRLASWSPDVVLQDLGLPDAEGVEAVVRVSAAAGSAPVVVLTGMAEDLLGGITVHAGAQDYLVKGQVEPEVLRRAVRYAIERKAAGEQLRAIQEQYRLVVDAAQEGVWVLDSDGVTTFANEALATMLGYRVDEIVGRPLREFMDADSRTEAAERFARRRRGVSERFESRMLHRDGHEVVVDVRAAPIIGPSGFEGATGLVTDISDKKVAEDRIRFQARLLDTVGQATVATDRHGRVTFWNRAAEKLFGWGADEAVGQLLTDLATPDLEAEEVRRVLHDLRSGKSWTAEVTMRRRNGSTLAVMADFTPVLDADGNVEAITGIVFDITRQKRTEAELRDLALRDALTGLPNRTLFLERVTHALQQRRREQTGYLGVLLVDLDHFKLVNDSYGHEAGDRLLVQVAALLSGALRPGDTVARLGGDEFAICCPGLDQPEDAVRVAERVLAALRVPYSMGALNLIVTASVGVTVINGHGDETPETLLRDADSAMYRAKDRGRARYELFEEGDRVRLVERLELEAELRDAVANGELRPVFHPHHELATGRFLGAEALVRWASPTRGLVSPAAFIPVAEQSDLIAQIDQFMFQEACAMAVRLAEAHPDRPSIVSTNLSGRTLAHPWLAIELEEILRASDVAPGRICVEITESVLMSDAEGSIRTLRQLKGLGLKVAIDDFGTGYSSLAYLKRFPIDYLKIDRSFVSGLGRDPEDAMIVKAVISLAKSLGFDVIAEGVETEEHLTELVRLGCERAQGYFWTPPVGPDDLLARAGQPGRTASSLPAQPIEAPAGELESGPSAIDPDTLVSIMAHELRSPLSVISGYASTLNESLLGQDPAFVRKAMDRIDRQARRMNRMLSAITDSGSLDLASARFSRETVDLASLVADIVDDLAPSIDNHEVRVTVAEDACVVDVDPVRIEQVVTNLVTNAAKYSPKRTPIEVVVERAGDDVAVRVVDQGAGIPSDRVGSVFKKFYRGDARSPGSGLGLYVSRSLARAHGGDVRYRRADGGGSEFSLVLPASRTGRVQRTSGPVLTAAPRPAPGVWVTDEAVVAARLQATRRLVASTTPEEVVGVAIELVRSLGGSTVPARTATAEALPVDLSFGQGEPLLPTCDPMSIARMRLEEVLPEFVEDARLAVQTVRRLERLEDEALVDPLTGLANRRAVGRALGSTGSGDAVAIIDIDHFKSINDNQGHDRGDLVLRSLARTIRQHLRLGDVCGRYGGDELVLVLSGTTPQEAGALLRRLRTAWERDRPDPVTFSAGVAAVTADGTSAVVAADRALYRAKEHGRDRVELATWRDHECEGESGDDDDE